MPALVEDVSPDLKIAVCTDGTVSEAALTAEARKFGTALLQPHAGGNLDVPNYYGNCLADRKISQQVNMVLNAADNHIAQAQSLQHGTHICMNPLLIIPSQGNGAYMECRMAIVLIEGVPHNRLAC